MTLRSWATPMIIGAFLVMAVTGTLMFFHLNGTLNKTLHEWAGLAMVIGGVGHVFLNWHPFTLYFRRPLAMAVMGVFAAGLALSFLPATLLPAGSSGGVNPGMLFAALGEARIATLADLTHQTPDALIARLAADGIAGATPEATVADLSGGNQGTSRAILSSAFAAQQPAN